MVDKVSDTHYKLVSEVYELKKDFAFKQEELQAMYIENKSLNNKIKLLEKENHSFKQQIKQLEEEQEDLLNYP
jgi:predicted nuclease with TOPRIM domain